VPWSSPDIDEIRGWNLESKVDGSKPAQIFHDYIQYNNSLLSKTADSSSRLTDAVVG
jgi:hypothetical protein